MAGVRDACDNKLDALRKLKPCANASHALEDPRADRPPPSLPGAPFSPPPRFHLRSAAAARRSSRSALRPPATRDRPQPILTRAYQGHGAVAVLRGATHRAPGLASELPRANSCSSLLPGRPAASGSCPAERRSCSPSRGTGAGRAPQPPALNGNCPFPECNRAGKGPPENTRLFPDQLGSFRKALPGARERRSGTTTEPHKRICC